MNKTQKIMLILAWFLLVTIFIFLFEKGLTNLLPDLAAENRSLIAFICAITLTAFLLDQLVKKTIQIKQRLKVKQKLATEVPQSPDDLLIFYLNDWNIYNIKINTNHSPFPFLSQKKIEWILPFTSFQTEEKYQLLKRVKMANQKLYMIQDDPKLKPTFRSNIEALFEEKKMDYAVLLQNKESFTQGFPAEQYEILETRDILEILLEMIEKIYTKNKRKKYEKELAFEDQILKNATEKNFILSVPDIEIHMRPKSFWWWKKAQPKPEKA